MVNLFIEILIYIFNFGFAGNWGFSVGDGCFNITNKIVIYLTYFILYLKLGWPCILLRIRNITLLKLDFIVNYLVLFLCFFSYYLVIILLLFSDKFIKK